MLEVHAILQRQRCNENITKKTGTLSDAYLSLALHKRYPVIWAADNIQELVLDDKATVENVYDVLAEIEDKCVHLSKLINIEFNPSNVQKLEEEYGVQISEHWKNYALNVINNFAGEVIAFAMQASSVR